MPSAEELRSTLEALDAFARGDAPPMPHGWRRNGWDDDLQAYLEGIYEEVNQTGEAFCEPDLRHKARSLVVIEVHRTQAYLSGLAGTVADAIRQHPDAAPAICASVASALQLGYMALGHFRRAIDLPALQRHERMERARHAATVSAQRARLERRHENADELGQLVIAEAAKLPPRFARPGAGWYTEACRRVSRATGIPFSTLTRRIPKKSLSRLRTE